MHASTHNSVLFYNLLFLGVQPTVCFYAPHALNVADIPKLYISNAIVVFYIQYLIIFYTNKLVAAH